MQANQSLRAMVPPPDHARYAESWKKTWLNPRVVVDTESITVVVGKDSIPVANPEDLAETLIKVPFKAWPHGRIAALSYTRRFVRDRSAQEALVDRLKSELADLDVEVIETPVGCDCE